MKSILAISAAAFCFCAAPAAEAALVADISVINRNTGERLPTYRHAGKLYVAGKPGDRYALELKNRTGDRLLTVVSVDGVNVVSGETAAANQRGPSPCANDRPTRSAIAASTVLVPSAVNASLVGANTVMSCAVLSESQATRTPSANRAPIQRPRRPPLPARQKRSAVPPQMKNWAPGMGNVSTPPPSRSSSARRASGRTSSSRSITIRLTICGLRESFQPRAAARCRILSPRTALSRTLRKPHG